MSLIEVTELIVSALVSDNFELHAGECEVFLQVFMSTDL